MFGLYNRDIRRNKCSDTGGVCDMYAEGTMTREEFRKARREQVQKEQNTMRKRILIFCVTLVLMFCMGVVFGSLLARAEETEMEQMHKYYANIQIQKGDTLWEIADEYMDDGHYESRQEYILEVMRMNHMTDSHLTAGEKLIVPYFAE